MSGVEVQCSGQTRSDMRCSNFTTNPNGLCGRHQDQSKEAVAALRAEAARRAGSGTP